MKYKDYLKLHSYRKTQYKIGVCPVCGNKMAYNKHGNYREGFAGVLVRLLLPEILLKRGGSKALKDI